MSSASLDIPAILLLLPHLADRTFLDDATFAAEADRLQADVNPERIKESVPFPELEEGVYRIRAEKMEELGEALAKLTKKADKLGVPAPTIETVRVEQLPVIVSFPTFANGRRDVEWVWARTGGVREYMIVRPSIAPVVLPGWSFAAKIEHLGEEGNILRTSPAFARSLPHAYRTDGPSCDHCRTARRRNATFVLHHTEDDRFVRVGHNCLADFIGDANAAQIVGAAAIEAALAELVIDEWDGEGGGGFGGGCRAAMPAAFLGCVALVIEKVGWCSRKLARDTDRRATADLAWRVMFPPPGAKLTEEEKELRRAAVTDAHRLDALAALAWAGEIPVDTDSDYLHNCRVIASLGAWDVGKIGLGAAILMSYQKEQDRLKRLEFERKLPSLPLGTVGERFGAGKGKKAIAPLTARVIGVHNYDGDYGLVTILRFQVASATEGHVHDCVWFASGFVNVVTKPEALAAKVTAEQAWEPARNALAAAQDAVYTASWDFDKKADLVQLKAEVERLKILADAAWAVVREIDVTDASRPIAVGDLVELGGTVKKHQLSDRSKRQETHLSRCTVKLILAALADEVAAK